MFSPEVDAVPLESGVCEAFVVTEVSVAGVDASVVESVIQNDSD